jgi:hypothetical protein
MRRRQHLRWRDVSIRGICQDPGSNRSCGVLLRRQNES